MPAAVPTCITRLARKPHSSNPTPCCPQDEECQREERALRKLAQARQQARKDKYPCKVAEGLYIGGCCAKLQLRAWSVLPLLPHLRPPCLLAFLLLLFPLAHPYPRPACNAACQACRAARLLASSSPAPCSPPPPPPPAGAVGAARNLKALQKAGITHVVNASPAVPCFFREHGTFEYLAVDLYDDPSADLLVHVDRVNEFIDSARKAGGGVLVHCYAGQSRSAALLMAYLMAEGAGRDMVSAWGAVRKARPCAKPNAGFLRQLAQYAGELGREGAFEVA